MSRRVTIKTLLVNQRRASPQSLAKHLRYIERDGVGRDGEPGRAYGPQTDEADLDAFKERCADDRHHFRFIVSPEDGAELDDLRTYTRHLMTAWRPTWARGWIGWRSITGTPTTRTPT
jgi:type IV secretory pathway VirD2 relaxase